MVLFSAASNFDLGLAVRCRQRVDDFLDHVADVDAGLLWPRGWNRALPSPATGGPSAWCDRRRPRSGAARPRERLPSLATIAIWACVRRPASGVRSSCAANAVMLPFVPHGVADLQEEIVERGHHGPDFSRNCSGFDRAHVVGIAARKLARQRLQGTKAAVEACPDQQAEQRNGQEQWREQALDDFFDQMVPQSQTDRRPAPGRPWRHLPRYRPARSRR